MAEIFLDPSDIPEELREFFDIVDPRTQPSVFRVNPRPYSGAHFAVMPPLLVEPCILAGTSERGCCPTCGAPWERVTEREKNSERDVESQRKLSSQKTGRTDGHIQGPSGLVDLTKTVGWTPTCKCPEHEPVPCTILDPFGGSGTVGMVARWHGRDSVLCELNPEYVKLIEERVEMERTETGGAKKPAPVVGGGASIDLLGDLFGGEG